MAVEVTQSLKANTMKAKLIILAVAAIALLSFTFSTNSAGKASKSAAAEQQKSTAESGGLAMEDRDQWK